MKKCWLILIICFISFYFVAQTKDEEKQFNKVLNKADTLFKQEEYKKALNLYERAYRLCECEYPYEQIRYIMDGNLIIRKERRNK